MKEIFTEEEYNEAVQKFNEQMKINFYSDVQNYSGYDGYVDLRKYHLAEDDFKLLWRCQDLLFTFDYLENMTFANCFNFYNEIKTLYLNYFKKGKVA